MRYRLRTLLILLAVGPPLLAAAWQAREVLIAAAQRTSFESWFRLLEVAVAIVVVAVAISRRDFGLDRWPV
jgi:hypothetical protein